MKLFTGWGRLGRDFTRTEFNNSHIKKNWGAKLTYDKYLESRVREKLNKRRRENYAKRKALLRNKFIERELDKIIINKLKTEFPEQRWLF